MKTLSQCTVLVVDDTEANVDILVGTLGNEYDVIVAMDGESALEIVQDTPPDLILLDILMPGLDGYEVCERIKADPGTEHIPVIFLTALAEEQNEAHGLELGAVDYITKPFSPELVKSRVRIQLELKRYRDHLEELVQERTREIQLVQEVTIESMAVLAEYRDPETGGHIRRTQNYVRMLAEGLKDHPKYRNILDSQTIDLLYKSAPLHDIGKVGVTDSVLLKPGRLNDAEFVQMKQHATYGYDAITYATNRLGTNSFMRYAREIARTHHEKWDGSGYPDGLSGEAIPLSGRIMAVADVYDALISKRVYKAPFTHAKAVDLIEEGRGKHFDPDVVDAFIALEEQFRQVALSHADHEEERIALGTPRSES